MTPSLLPLLPVITDYGLATLQMFTFAGDPEGLKLHREHVQGLIRRALPVCLDRQGLTTPA